MRRQRSAKRLGTRHNLNYFKQWTTWRRARMALAIAVPVIAVGWLAAMHMSGNTHPANSGPLSRSHSFVANDCAACHSRWVAGVRIAAFQQHTSDEACVTCHAAPVHHADQMFTPGCGSCHVEHKGIARLSEVSDSNCVNCHAHLSTTNGRLQFATKITSFNSDHPEFAALRSPDLDQGTIAFNHAVHIKPVLGPGNKQVQLECVDCHRTAVDQQLPWRFAEAGYKPAAVSPGRSYMVAPTYAGTCAGCHDLRFDPRFPQSAPHDKPQVVFAFLQNVYGGKPLAPVPVAARSIPLSGLRASRVTSSDRESAANLLWGKTCKLCHQLQREPGAALPTITASQIANVWLKDAKFDHAAHRSFSCVSCHTRAPTSTMTSEVLVPGIATCQTCHNGNPQQAGRSDNRCFECHEYHDWKQQPMFKGRYNINQLRGRRNGD